MSGGPLGFRRLIRVGILHFLSLYIDYKQIWKYKQVDFSDFSVGKVYNFHGILEIDQLVFGYDQMHLYS